MDTACAAGALCAGTRAEQAAGPRSYRARRLGKCSKRGMALVPEGTRFGLLRHMFASPWHITAMVVIMILIMAAIMMLVR